ncbi:hypothetical protein GWK47_025911 [Chionoecetes opilio]|uniref:Uncharacterized protein n=1 Tax=Chionoecetes opilio TaxID=41210 RepID=A0A8J8WBZ3_CHIOP|nr:hypothetical protein GWK47_025911 [Chionoecetes opilio]
MTSEKSADCFQRNLFVNANVASGFSAGVFKRSSKILIRLIPQHDQFQYLLLCKTPSSGPRSFPQEPQDTGFQSFAVSLSKKSWNTGGRCLWGEGHGSMVSTCTPQNLMKGPGIESGQAPRWGGYHGEPRHSLWRRPGKGEAFEVPGCDGDWGLHNLEEEPGAVPRLWQPEVEDGMSANPRSAVSLTTRSPSIRRGSLRRTIPLTAIPRIGGQEAVLISRASKRRRMEFFVAKECSVPQELMMMGGLFAWHVPRLLHRRDRPVQLLVVGDREGRESKPVTGHEIFAQYQKWAAQSGGAGLRKILRRGTEGCP